jgi:hypothetical protein
MDTAKKAPAKNKDIFTRFTCRLLQRHSLKIAHAINIATHTALSIIMEQQAAMASDFADAANLYGLKRARWRGSQTKSIRTS